MLLGFGVEVWVRSLAERLDGAAAEGTEGGLTGSWDAEEEELPIRDEGMGGGVDECLRDLL